MKAGAFTPATPRRRPRRRGPPTPLNEGGGFHPRNPSSDFVEQGRIAGRSMKAGALTPATPATVAVPAAGLQRSMKAGAFTPATPGSTPAAGRCSAGALNEGGGFHPRNPVGGGEALLEPRRSMKAGAFTPATLEAMLMACRSPINAQ